MEELSSYKKWFKDHLNPTDGELKKWMKDPESFEPEQDWDLIIGDASRLEAFVVLANSKGPQREDVVHYLYVSTASAFNHDRNKIRKGIALVSDDGFSDLLEWRKKAMLLLKEPNSFREREWLDYRYNQ